VAASTFRFPAQGGVVVVVLWFTTSCFFVAPRSIVSLLVKQLVQCWLEVKHVAQQQKSSEHHLLLPRLRLHLQLAFRIKAGFALDRSKNSAPTI
jgi:hypothetical protein